MAEYIEREATIATIAKHMASVNAHCYSVNHNKEQYDLYAMATNHAIDYVRCIPAADVVPEVHGRWIYHECVASYDGAISGYSCSECNAFVDEEIFDMDELHKDFCGNCGARMDGEDNDC